jgi:hypothetical protein
MRFDYVKNHPATRGAAVAALTGAFTFKLAVTLEAAEIELATLKNAQTGALEDHLHDYCDANQVMLDAVELVFSDLSEEDVAELITGDSHMVDLVEAAWAETGRTLNRVFL